MAGSGRRPATVTKFVSTLAIVVLGLVALGAVGPRIAQIIDALVPLVAVAGIVLAVLRVAWFYTRRW
jgi:Na+/alanine symporter